MSSAERFTKSESARHTGCRAQEPYFILCSKIRIISNHRADIFHCCLLAVKFPSFGTAGLWNYQNLLLVRTSNWSKSNQNLLAWKFTFFLVLEENIYCGHSLDASETNEYPYRFFRCTSNEYPQHKFSSRNKKNIYPIIWIIFLFRGMKVLDN